MNSSTRRQFRNRSQAIEAALADKLAPTRPNSAGSRIRQAGIPEKKSGSPMKALTKT